MNKRNFSVICATLLVASCVFADEVFNDDFEHGAGRWRLPSKQWSVADGEGLDGSRALALEYAKGEMPVWIEHNEMFRVEPGEAYRIEAWVNDSAFHAKDCPVSISFAVYDEKNQHIRESGARSKRVIDNIIRKDGFYRVEGTSRPLPANARKARFYIWAKEGSYGRVRFDGFRAYTVAVNPLVDLCCSAYRNEAAKGEVRFSAGYAVNELKHDMKKVRAELRYVSPNGRKTLDAALSDGVASAVLPVAAFAFGTNEVRMVLKEGNKTLGESSCKFARLRRLPSRRVYFDSFNRTVVDGKPSFPLGMYCNDINVNDLAAYTNGTPFNCLMPYRRPDATGMDLCEAAGVKVILPICGFYELLAGTNVQKAAEVKAKHIDGVVDKFRSHPAVLAWYLADEVTTAYAGLLEERNRMCHEKDPDHPTWVCLNRPANVRPFVNGYDAVGMDPYPIGSPFANCEIGMAADWAQQAMRGMYRSRGMWQVPQAFDWSPIVKDMYVGQRKGRKNPPEAHMPTREEMRSMSWQAIAGGANGLVYYKFEGVYKRGGTKEENARRWADICAVAREIKEKEAVLLSAPGPTVADVPEGVVCRTWKTAGGKVYLLACNTTRAAIKGSVCVSGKAYRIDLPPIGVSWIVMGNKK